MMILSNSNEQASHEEPKSPKCYKFPRMLGLYTCFYMPRVLNITRPAGTRATNHSMLPLPWPILTPQEIKVGRITSLIKPHQHLCLLGINIHIFSKKCCPANLLALVLPQSFYYLDRLKPPNKMNNKSIDRPNLGIEVRPTKIISINLPTIKTYAGISTPRNRQACCFTLWSFWKVLTTPWLLEQSQETMWFPGHLKGSCSDLNDDIIIFIRIC